MKETIGPINPLNPDTVRQIRKLKDAQDEATNRLASDTTGIIGVGDTDMVNFLTPPFKDLRMLQVKSGPDMYGTLALIPEQQHVFAGGHPFFRDGSAVALDRAGSAAFTNNIVRAGKPPDGFAREATTRYIQRRVARTFNPGIDRVSYIVELFEVPLDYVLQPDERFDGDFSWLNAVGIGDDYTSIPPTDSQGRRLYNGDPLTEAGWDGTVYTVEYNADTIPYLYSVDPPTYQLPDNSGVNFCTLYGLNFTLYQVMLVGPYVTTGVINIFPGIGVQFIFPSNMAPGIYDVVVVSEDGQVGILPAAITVLAE